MPDPLVQRKAPASTARKTDTVRAKARARGRPTAAQRDNIDQRKIIATAFAMTREVSLQKVSISAVAECLGISQNLVRYYAGTRRQLTSSVIDAFFVELLQRWPEPSGEWMADLRDASRAIFEHFLHYPGMCEYAACHCRSRLFLLDISNVHVSGLDVLNRFIGLVRASGLPPARVGVFADLFMLFLANTAHAWRRDGAVPEDRAFFEQKGAALPASLYPNIAYAFEGLPLASSPDAFDGGMDLLILGIAYEVGLAQDGAYSKVMDYIMSKGVGR